MKMKSLISILCTGAILTGLVGGEAFATGSKPAGTPESTFCAADLGEEYYTREEAMALVDSLAFMPRNGLSDETKKCLITLVPRNVWSQFMVMYIISGPQSVDALMHILGVAINLNIRKNSRDINSVAIYALLCHKTINDMRAEMVNDGF